MRYDMQKADLLKLLKGAATLLPSECCLDILPCCGGRPGDGPPEELIPELNELLLYSGGAPGE